MKFTIAIHTEILKQDGHGRNIGEHQVKLDEQIIEVFPFNPISDSFAKAQARSYVKGIQMGIDLAATGVGA